MTKDKLAQLEQLCPEAAYYCKNMDQEPIPTRLVNVDREDWDAIADRLLELADLGMKMAMECGDATGHLKFLRTVCDMSEIPSDTLAEIDKCIARKERP